MLEVTNTKIDLKSKKYSHIPYYYTIKYSKQSSTSFY